MTLWLVILLPLLGGLSLWLADALDRGGPSRAVMAAAGGAVVLATGVLAGWAAALEPSGALPFGGGLALSLQVSGAVRVMTVLVPTVALPIVLWAAAHEARIALGRLVGLLVVFVGCMELLVLAGDLLTLAMGWELVGGLSWALIAHRWREDEHVGAATYAFIATHLGGLGLWVAAAAALTSTGTLDFAALDAVTGGWRHALVAGLLVAAAAKSAQAVFAPWLLRAMQGPSSVSALLHSSTMVAAGAWLLIRLHDVLATVPWFAPAVLAIGLTTALAGGLVAAVQPHAKRLLAASTSAQYGLMFVAAGAGSTAAALAHLVAHAALKALLFLAAGVAMGAVGSGQLRQMRLGRRLPVVAAASLVGALALAAIPPLGAAWTKEQIVAAAGHQGAIMALLTIAAGAFSAWYAMRFQALAFGRAADAAASRQLAERPGVLEKLALWFLAGLCLILGLSWLPVGASLWRAILPGELPAGKTWELVVSFATVLAAGAAAWTLAGRRAGDPSPARVRLADWLGLPTLIDGVVTRPTLGLAAICAAVDDRVVDAGVRGAGAVGRWLSRQTASLLERGVDGVVQMLAAGTALTARGSSRFDAAGVDGAVDGIGAGTGRAGQRTRAAHRGAIPAYYSLIAAGAIVLLLILTFGR